MSYRRWLLVAAVAVLALGATACGDDSAGGELDASQSDARIPMPLDAGPDADLRDAEPPPRDDAGALVFGPGLILDDVSLAESGHSWAPYAPLVNVELDTVVADGTMIVLVELRGLDDPSGQNDSALDLGLYSGVDPDGIPGDNFTGAELLQVSADSLDSLGRPRSLLEGAAVSNGALAGADPGPLSLYFPTLGELTVYDVTFQGTLAATPDGMAVASLGGGSIAGVLLARDLGLMDNPVPGMCLGDTFLDVISQGCLGLDGIQPDVDRDGDGLERFEEKLGMIDWVIDRCVDGDGTEYASVPGVPCVLDPAFADGYTVLIQVTGVRAILVPPTP